MATVFVIEDWAGKRLFPKQEFSTFEDAWGFIRETFPEDDWQVLYVVKYDVLD